MGQELDTTDFCDADYDKFVERLHRETDLVRKWEEEGALSDGPATAGFELEAWIVDRNMRPAAKNDELIEAINSELVVQELSLFNIELNGDPEILTGSAISHLHDNLADQWNHASNVANGMGLHLANIGILPTLRDHDLCIENMSKGKRYRAVNKQVFKMRHDKPIGLNIKGRDQLDTVHHDVMLEAATTSFQIHLKIPPDQGANYYNASKLASIPLVAIGANSPFLFGKDLWDETRIPLFEQAVSVGDWDYAERATFGVRFIEESLCEVFVANRQRYPVLLPQVSGRGDEKLDHLRLQNGTIWRWNRPLVGWDDDGTPHFRMEQRVVSAGPTIADSMANAAFYYGLVTFLATHEVPPHKRTQFFTARDNFYAAAQHGMNAKIRWDHVDDLPIDRLICETFLPMAAEGLRALEIAETDIDKYLGIIDERAASRQNGARWQREYVAKHKVDMTDLLSTYLVHQQSDIPVHRWPL